MLTEPIGWFVPRSKRIHWPSPWADQRVAIEPSNALAGVCPSSALADADKIGIQSATAPITLPGKTIATATHTHSEAITLFSSVPNDCPSNRFSFRTELR